MAVTNRPARLPAVVVVVALALSALAGCSSADEGAGSDAATTATTARASTSVTTGDTTVPTEDTTASTAAPGELPSSPSTIPGSVDSACAALAETYGLEAIRPMETSSWFDERQRIVVDAEREARLLALAGQTAPGDVAAALATMEAYATWLGTTVGGSSNAAEAIAAVDGYPDAAALGLAVDTVAAWRAANCPA